MPANRINHLVDELNVYARQYYVMDDPSISDASYDALYAELKSLEQQHPELIRADSPTQRVGDRLSGKFESVKLSMPMLSLDNAFTVDDMAKALATMNSVYEGVSIELKADGLAVNLRYENGLLVRATTRGDGMTGEDVTHTVKTIQSVPLRLLENNVPTVIEVRGEVVMPKKALEQYNAKARKEGGKPLANARNGAAGAIRQLDPKKAAERQLEFLAYSVGEVSPNFNMPTTQSDLLAYFIDLGFGVSEYTGVVHTIEQCEHVFNEIIEKRDSFSYLIDGIVFKTNTIAGREQIGSTSKFPKWAIAWKLPPEVKETKLLDVKYQTAQSGAVSPVAVLAPVHVGGVTISTTTLHNEAQLTERLQLRVGDTVRILRSGDVVPCLDSRVDLPEQADAPRYAFTTSCPSCGGALEKHDATWYCMNESSCPAQLSKRLVRAAGRDCLDIEGFGSAFAETIVELGITTDSAGIFTLKDHRDQLIQLDGYGEKSIDKLLSAIENAKRIPLARFIYLLNIDDVGRSLSATLAKKYMTFEAFMSAPLSDLLETDDVGTKTGDNIRTFFDDPRNQALVAKLLTLDLEIMPPEAPPVSAAGADYAGKTFVVTGTFSTIARKVIEAHIKLYGGKVSGSPSAKTTATIAGDKAGSKLQKSQDLGLKIITDDDIVNAINDDAERLPELLMTA